jgi:hypothetical protein
MHHVASSRIEEKRIFGTACKGCSEKKKDMQALNFMQKKERRKKGGGREREEKGGAVRKAQQQQQKGRALRHSLQFQAGNGERAPFRDVYDR